MYRVSQCLQHNGRRKSLKTATDAIACAPRHNFPRGSEESLPGAQHASRENPQIPQTL